MIVKWFPDAKYVMKQTASYIQTQFGEISCKVFLREVVRTEKLLRENPHLGSVEPLLSDLPKTYRSIVVQKLNKIVYYVEDNTIYIVDFWDVRREPRKQREHTIAGSNNIE